MSTKKPTAGASCVGAVSLIDIADALGWPNPAPVGTRAQKEGLTVGADWRGDPALAADDAAWLVALLREEAQRDSDENRRYQEYLNERRREAEQKRIDEARKRHEEREEKKRRGLLEWAKEVGERNKAESSRNELSAAEEAGNPVSYDAWKAGKR